VGGFAGRLYAPAPVGAFLFTVNSASSVLSRLLMQFRSGVAWKATREVLGAGHTAPSGGMAVEVACPRNILFLLRRHFRDDRPVHREARVFCGRSRPRLAVLLRGSRAASHASMQTHLNFFASWNDPGLLRITIDRLLDRTFGERPCVKARLTKLFSHTRKIQNWPLKCGPNFLHFGTFSDQRLFPAELPKSDLHPSPVHSAMNMACRSPLRCGQALLERRLLWIREIAVETLIAERPPHRTERAQFGHSAPTSDA
jgi:hypothetical protein